MYLHTIRRRARRARQGAMLVLIAVTIVLLLIAVAFSIDVAYMQLTRTELRTSTDAAARAAIESLSRTQNVGNARQAARDAAFANEVAGAGLLLDDGDIVFGRSNRAGANGYFGFDAAGAPQNSVLVTGRRTDDSPSGPVGLLFAGVLGPRTFVPVQNARAIHLDRDICLVIDRSGSMNQDVVGTGTSGGDWCNGPHPTLSRWAALREALQVFLQELNATQTDESVAMVSYSSNSNICGVAVPESRIDVPLVSEYTPIIQAMINYSATTDPSTPAMNNNRVGGATNISAGVRLGTQVVTDPTRARPFAEQTMIVLTDGIANTPGGETVAANAVIQAARNAKAANRRMTIHSITFSDSARQDTMQEVAREGGGNHYHAPTAARLEEIFREIARTLPVVTTE